MSSHPKSKRSPAAAVAAPTKPQLTRAFMIAVPIDLAENVAEALFVRAGEITASCHRRPSQVDNLTTARDQAARLREMAHRINEAHACRKRDF